MVASVSAGTPEGPIVDSEGIDLVDVLRGRIAEAP